MFSACLHLFYLSPESDGVGALALLKILAAIFHERYLDPFPPVSKKESPEFFTMLVFLGKQAQRDFQIYFDVFSKKSARETDSNKMEHIDSFSKHYILKKGRTALGAS